MPSDMYMLYWEWNERVAVSAKIWKLCTIDCTLLGLYKAVEARLRACSLDRNSI